MTVDINRRPYFDDYDENKSFQQILFVPRRAVQVRELTQVQTLFQKQIERFANHVFENGSLVIPGELNYDLDYSYIKVNINDLITVQNLLQKGLKLSTTSGVTAELDLYVAAESGDPSTFYIKYLKANESSLKFQASDVVQIRDSNDILLTTATVIEEGIGSKVTVNTGVYYINGRFVLNQEQSLVISKYTNTPSVSVGFDVIESIVTERDDVSLNDNAQGSTNFTAPGAHRLKVDLILKAYAITDLPNADDSFVEIFRIKDGIVQKKARGPEYNILGDVLAQRTYEESGDYTVKSFSLGLKEHLNDGINSGVFTALEGGDSSKYVAQIDSGIAYVRGYRVENLSTINVVANKARDTAIVNNSSFSASLGYYILIDNLSRIPNVKDFVQVSFYDDEAFTPGSVPSGALIGTANIRFIQKDGASYRLYLFNIRNTDNEQSTAFLSDAVSVYHTDFTASVVSTNLFDTANNSLIYPLNVSNVKTLKDNLGVADTSFSTVRQFTGTLDTNGVIIFSTAANEVFVSQTDKNSFVSYTDIVEFDDVVGNFTLGGSPTGSTITIDLGVSNASRPVIINLETAKETVVQKTKTKTTTSITGSLTSGVLSLEKADAIRIISVTDNDSNDVTDLFTLNQNKTRSFYNVSTVQTSAIVAQPITVQFEYFAHSSGDYFGVDSYSGINYEDIPVEDGVRLSDVLDFRPRISNNGSSFTAIGSSVGNIPVPYSIVRSDVEYYLPRIDKVYVDFKGNFGIYEGTPSSNPKEPSEISGAMTLYTLYVPAYTFNTSDINAVKRNNKRYTMRDIGNLETRIANVEYYVALNYLEQEALSKQILDIDTGLNRFKNGIMVDPFVDLRYSDINWSGFGSSVSASNGGSLRPAFSLNAVDFEVNESESSDVVINNGIATLPFTNTVFIEQRFATNSINVNPYAVYRWSADINLSPSSDTWFDTVLTEPEVIFETVQTGSVISNLFDGWQINWSGVENSVNIDQSGVFSSAGTSANTLIQNFGDSAGLVTGSIITQNTTVSTNSDFVGERVVSTSVIPFMRSIDITVTGVGNRPNATLNFFFDGVNVNDYVRPVSGSFSDDIISDADGSFTAIYRVPNSNTDRFRTGERILTVTDESNNNRVLATSYGQATFTSQGSVRTVQQTIVSTRTERTNIDVLWVDPVAQSFLVESDGGAFVTEIDVFFETKDDVVPVTVDIREMENGNPTSRVVPGSKVTLIPSQVNTSSDATVATTFEFKQPIYLNDNTEYCFVVSSNSENYNIFIATLGSVDLNTQQAIAKQPYAGVMFKSQNSSTWTADQNSDIKFTIRKAQFDINTNGLLYLENESLDLYPLVNNAITTESGSSEVVIYKKSHNYIVGTTVTISDAVGGNGIVTNDLNDTFIVTEIVSKDQFKVDTLITASASGSIGGSNAKITNTIQASLLMPNVTELKLPKTDIAIEVKGTSGQSVSGTETAYQDLTVWQKVENKENFELSRPWIITSDVDESLNLSGNKSIAMRINLTSDNANISPVIDVDSCTVITPFYLVNNDPVLEEDASNNYANNRSVAVTLAQPSVSLRVYLDVSMPQDSDVIVLGRFGNTLDELESSAWQEIEPVNALATSGRGIFVEQEFSIETTSTFTVYQTMIQLKSSSAALIPIVRKLRTIALGT